jgi:hypothetical protein
MRATTWAVLTGLAFCVPVGVGQDSRPESRGGTPPPAPKDGVFRPFAPGTEFDARFSMVKGTLAIRWIDRERPKAVVPNPTAAQLSEHGTMVARQRVAALRFEKEESVRRQVSAAGMPHKSGASVLPLGRFEWEKGPLFVKPGESPKVAMIGVLVATASLPVGDVKGFRVKGEFQDDDGNARSRLTSVR